MKMLRSALIALVVLLSDTAHAQPDLPDGWITDYDYEERLNVYLKRQYDVAVQRQLVPYAYVYADWCRPCTALRERVKSDPDFAKVFTGTQIVALHFEGLRTVKEKPEFLTLGVPLIVPIESDGTLSSAFAINGVPWTRVPGNIVETLCAFFGARAIRGATADGCPAVSR
jgi:hypothetical protein